MCRPAPGRGTTPGARAFDPSEGAVASPHPANARTTATGNQRRRGMGISTPPRSLSSDGWAFPSLRSNEASACAWPAKRASQPLPGNRVLGEMQQCTNERFVRYHLARGDSRPLALLALAIPQPQQLGFDAAVQSVHDAVPIQVTARAAVGHAQLRRLTE